MILIDFSGVALSNIHGLVKDMHPDDFDESFFRHSVIHAIRSHKVRFSPQYGEVVLCIDCAPYWRKSIFPEYKENRKDAKKKSKINWDDVYGWMRNIIDELDDVFPFKVIAVPTMEGDDVIAALVQKYHTREKILIVSNDGDLLQLGRYSGVKQFSPMKKDFIQGESNIIRALNEKVLRGDAGDGIPSIKCPNNHFVREDKVRAKPMKKAEVELWSSLSGVALMEALPKEYHAHYIRNKKLIDLRYVPEHLLDKAVETYENYTNTEYNMMKLVAYFSKHKMRRLLEYVTDFN